MKTLPEKLEFTIKAEGTSQGSQGKRQVWSNKQYGVTLIVTWAPPYPDIGIQQFSCKDIPHGSYRTYEELRRAYEKHWATKS